MHNIDDVGAVSFLCQICLKFEFGLFYYLSLSLLLFMYILD